MSYRTWTADALKSNVKHTKGECWRLVEAQHRVSTLKIVDTLQEQERLEYLLEDVKPPIPDELLNFDPLLYTPFRYGPYKDGTRFRRPSQKEGAFYASMMITTALAEMAFYRFLFFKESPDTPVPVNACDYTAFCVPYETSKLLDLTSEPLNKNVSEWCDKQNYEPCQHLADQAREADIEILKSFSVRCPKKGKNITIISWKAFKTKKPTQPRTWKMSIKKTEIIVSSDFPKQRITFDISDFEDDPRINNMAKLKQE